MFIAWILLGIVIGVFGSYKSKVFYGLQQDDLSALVQASQFTAIAYTAGNEMYRVRLNKWYSTQQAVRFRDAIYNTANTGVAPLPIENYLEMERIIASFEQEGEET